MDIVTQPTADLLPDHTQLPDEDGNCAGSFLEHPQSRLLDSSLSGRIHELFGDHFSIGRDNGIYWKYVKEDPLKGCKAPDWFLIPNVPHMLDGKIRRSYVMWQERVKPLLVIEYVSGDGSEERDTTPENGKFWVYEQGIGASYYVIFDNFRATLEGYHLHDRAFQRLPANETGRISIPPLRIELGLWYGKHEGVLTTWLRAWDATTGHLFPTVEERIQTYKELAELYRQIAEARRQTAKYRTKLRELGFDPDAA